MATVKKNLSKNESWTPNTNMSTSADINTITTKGGTGTITLSGGTNTYNITNTTDAQTFNGGRDNDTFIISAKSLTGVTIDGGTGTTPAYNGANGAFTARTGSSGYVLYTGSNPSAGGVLSGTSNANNSGSNYSDAKVQVAGRPGATTSFNQSTSVLDATSLKDSIKFTVSGDYSTGLSFTNIEKLELSSGVTIKLNASALKAAFNSLDKGDINPGLQIYGVAGGKQETLIANLWSDGVAADDDDGDDGPVGVVDPIVGRSYYSADLQLDDFTIGDVINNVTFIYQGNTGTGQEVNSYVRVDGSNSTEKAYGAEGADYATMRLGDDTYYGYGGNDLLIGHGGADSLFGGNGNDLFTIGGFGSGVAGTTSKSDDGNTEWVTTGAKKDLIDGGAGIDILRVTSGVGATDATTGKLLLNNTNIKNLERIEVGASVSKDPDESQYQYQQDEHWYLDKSGTVTDTTTAKGGVERASILNSINQVVIDASTVTLKGLTFEGNANIQTFKGTSLADIFIGNGGHDVLTGGTGNAIADTFVYQTVRTYARDSSTANGEIKYNYTDTPLTEADSDIITDFKSGVDKVQFRVETTTTLEDTFDSLVSLKGSALTNANYYEGADRLGATSSHLIQVITNGTGVDIYYDDNGGATGGFIIATLQSTALNDITFSDFSIANVMNF